MNLTQLIYSSRPFGFDPKHGITGALICRADMYLQLLEGDATAVDSTFARITRDDRHLEMKVLYRMPASERLFPYWAMRDDPPRSWMWTKPEIAEGALSRASPNDIIQVFKRVAAEPD